MYWLAFTEAKGLVTVLDHKSFADTIQKFTTDDDYFADMTRNQEKCAKQWGVLDGKAAERIAHELDRLVELKCA